MAQTAPLLQDDGNDLGQPYGGRQTNIQSGHSPMGQNIGPNISQSNMGHSLADSEATTPPSSELISNPPIPIPPDNLGVSFGTNPSINAKSTRIGASGGSTHQASYSNTGANVTATNNSPYSAHMQPTSAAILQSGGGGGSGAVAAQIFASAHGSIHNELSYSRHNNPSTHHQNNINNGGYGHLASGDGGRYDGTIPLVSKITFVFIWLGIIVTFVAMIATILLTINYYHKDTNNSDEKKGTVVIRNIRCVIIPLTSYLLNALICLMFYIESRRLQIHGYSDLYLKTSEIVKINFRACSAYFTLAFAAYAFLSNTHKSVSIRITTIDILFLIIWCLVFIFIMFCLTRFFYLFYNHNKFRPRPNLFDAAARDATNLNNSPSTSNQYATNNPKAVIQQLINDKKTLQRQLRNVSAQLTRTQNQLKAVGGRNSNTSDAKINVATRSPRTSMDGGIGGRVGRGGSDANNSNSNLTKQESLQIAQYEDDLRRYKNQVRTLKATIKTAKSEIDTTKTVLDSKKSECDQQKGLIANYERHIANLTQEKEVLENQYNQMMDQKNDNSVLMSVKEEELDWAKKENNRLRQQVMQLNAQLSQNVGGNMQQQHPQQQQGGQRYQR